VIAVPSGLVERVYVKAVPPLRPRASLGQNFLRDPNVAHRIVATVAPGPGDTVLEIGPGEGALTFELAALAGRLVIVDLDERVVARMREALAGKPVEVIYADVLRLDLKALADRVGPLRVVGNIPYNITSPILFHVLENRAVIRDCVLLMQREVALRLAAVPRTKDYSVLSIMTQFYADVEVVFDVPPTVFYPKPKVTSSLVHLRPLSQPRVNVLNEDFFRSMVRGVFGKRRKTLRNSLRYFLETEPPAVSFDLGRRPEELTLQELGALSDELVRAGHPAKGSDA
jgi:16S rRNA (adenine1518-N6/adenine1519-N6)-dimethyltransferase